jgi:hypothetical protein
MTAIVSRVTVHDDGTTRRTRITITEGRTGTIWTANPASIPPPARDELLDWLGAPKSSTERPWHGDSTASAHIEPAYEPPSIDARIGFTPGP